MFVTDTLALFNNFNAVSSESYHFDEMAQNKANYVVQGHHFGYRTTVMPYAIS